MDKRIASQVASAWDETLEREYRLLGTAASEVGSSCCCIEVGCGSLGLLNRKPGLARLYEGSIGIDPDLKSLSKNQQVKRRLCGTCYQLPLKDNSVDVIVCRWVFEHLETPDEAMREFARVLKKGGLLFVKTPNLFNYVMQISRMTPTWFHNLVRFASGSESNIQTFYRANTRRRLYELAAETGFTVKRIESDSASFMYYAFNKELFLVMRAISRCVAKVTNSMQLTLICLLQKVGDD